LITVIFPYGSRGVLYSFTKTGTIKGGALFWRGFFVWGGCIIWEGGSFSHFIYFNKNFRNFLFFLFLLLTAIVFLYNTHTMLPGAFPPLTM